MFVLTCNFCLHLWAPVGDVQAVFEDGQGIRSWESVSQHLLFMVEIWAADLTCLQVDPVEFLENQVDCESMRPSHTRIGPYHCMPVESIHVSTVNGTEAFRRLRSHWVEHVAKAGCKCHGGEMAVFVWHNIVAVASIARTGNYLASGEEVPFTTPRDMKCMWFRVTTRRLFEFAIVSVDDRSTDSMVPNLASAQNNLCWSAVPSMLAWKMNGSVPRSAM